MISCVLMSSFPCLFCVLLARTSLQSRPGSIRCVITLCVAPVLTSCLLINSIPSIPYLYLSLSCFYSLPCRFVSLDGDARRTRTKSRLVEGPSTTQTVQGALRGGSPAPLLLLPDARTARARTIMPSSRGSRMARCRPCQLRVTARSRRRIERHRCLFLTRSMRWTRKG